ncbi:hypothetical protein OROMI_002322 [Orobanche minor]
MSLVKRSWSEGHILPESRSPTCAPNFSKDFPGAEFSSESEGGIKTMSESTPEISTSERQLAYLRCTPLPARKLFAEMQRDRNLEHEYRSTIDCSNFVDVDWLSSSGNSFDEELLERNIHGSNLECYVNYGLNHIYLREGPNQSMLTAAHVAVMSSENVLIKDQTTSTSECESSTRGMEQTGMCYDEVGNSEVFDEFPDSFVRWVTNGETLCH